MESISIYGYEPDMLEATRSIRPEVAPASRESTALEDNNRAGSLAACYLLHLPAEIRAIIFSYILPSTYHAGRKGTTWLCGNLALMFANKQIYAEAAAIMYGRSSWVIDTTFGGSSFRYQYRTSGLQSDLVSTRRLAFPEYLASRNIQLMRRFNIRVHHVDSYIGTIKYNYGGQGLTNGLLDHVKFLLETLRSIPEITSLHIDYRDDSHTPGTAETVLEPFFTLQNTRTITLSGALSPTLSQKLKSHLTNAYWKSSLLRLPPEVRRLIYTHIFPSASECSSKTLARTPSWMRGRLSILQASKLIHAEASAVFYAQVQFAILVTARGNVWFGPRWYTNYKRLYNQTWATPSGWPNSMKFERVPRVRDLTIVGCFAGEREYEREYAASKGKLDRIYAALLRHLRASVRMDVLTVHVQDLKRPWALEDEAGGLRELVRERRIGALRYVLKTSNPWETTFLNIFRGEEQRELNLTRRACRVLQGKEDRSYKQGEYRELKGPLWAY